MSAVTPLHIAIVGAGLSGLALALALHDHSISCEIFEAHKDIHNVGGGLMLMPNGLRVLQSLGLETSIREKGFSFERAYLQHGLTGRILETIDFGSNDLYGLSALRVYRHEVLATLLAKVISLGISVRYNCKLQSIISENHNQVCFKLENGSTSTASFLIGADGIHSTVRGYVNPGIEPYYTGACSISASVSTSDLQLPQTDLLDLTSPTNKYPLPTGLVIPQVGAFVIAPQTPDGSELLITTHKRMKAEPNEEAWNQKTIDKTALLNLLRRDAECYPVIVGNALRNIEPSQLFLWPFYEIPPSRWASQSGRVILVGDSAHALPPSIGQGVSQALEDIYTLAAIFGKLSKTGFPAGLFEHALNQWSTFRAERITVVLALNHQMDFRRMPQEVSSGEELKKCKEPLDFMDLYNINLDQRVLEFFIFDSEKAD